MVWPNANAFDAVVVAGDENALAGVFAAPNGEAVLCI